MKSVELLKKIFLIDLLKGLLVTFRHQHPDNLVTEQYPQERPAISGRFRGQPRLVKDENGNTLCTACGACALACPEKLIKVRSQVDPETKKKVLTEFNFDMGRCMFCGLCQDACNAGALNLSQDYEIALYTREGLELNRKQLEDGTPRKVYDK
jgi:NADH-quinone oxidoreductase subunit I